MLWIERTLAADVIPQLERDADSELLAGPLAEHRSLTREHAVRVEEVFVAAGAEPAAAASAPLEALRRRYVELKVTIVEPRLRDVFLIESARAAEALEVMLYTSVIPLGRLLRIEIAPLERSLEDEKRALAELDRVADAVRGRLPS